MKKLFYLSVVYCSFCLITSCNTSNEDPEPTSEPYFTIYDKEQVYQEGYEKQEWIVITNGLGEVVGWKKLNNKHEEILMTDRKAEVKDKINVHKISVKEIDSGPTLGKSHSLEISSYLGLSEGMHLYMPLPVDPPVTEEVILNLANIPKESIATIPSTSGGLSVQETDYDLYDGILDKAKFGFAVDKEATQCLFSIYSKEMPKYLWFSNPFTNEQEYDYVNDFEEFDHVIEVSTGTYPNFVGTQGISDGKATTFMALAWDLEKVAANTSVKLCYVDGFDFYITNYILDGKGYYRQGSIPTNLEVIIPTPTISVTNSGMSSFQAIFPDQMDWRRSGYSYSTKTGNTAYSSQLSVYSTMNNLQSFDLATIPQEILDAYPAEFSFDLLQYNGSTFYESSNTFVDYYKWIFGYPEHIMRDYYFYSVPK